VQGGVQLRGVVLDRVGGDGRDDAVRDGPPVRRAGDDGVRVARGRRLHPGGRAGHGRDLLRLPHLRRPLLLERQALRPPPVGALRRLAHRLVSRLLLLILPLVYNLFLKKKKTTSLLLLPRAVPFLFLSNAGLLAASKIKTSRAKIFRRY
jgi:hypothetical protein